MSRRFQIVYLARREWWEIVGALYDAGADELAEEIQDQIASVQANCPGLSEE